MLNLNHLCSARTRWFSICMTMLLLAGISLSVSGQTIVGRISGTVKDESGAVIPNANVTATNKATGLARTATTDGGGFYTITNLPVGTYSLAFEQTGFKRASGPARNIQFGLKVTF